MGLNSAFKGLKETLIFSKIRSGYRNCHCCMKGITACYRHFNNFRTKLNDQIILSKEIEIIRIKYLLIKHWRYIRIIIPLQPKH